MGDSGRASGGPRLLFSRGFPRGNLEAATNADGVWLTRNNK